MDFQRYLLIGAIAVLSYMLVVEWTHFQQKHADAPAAAALTPPTPDTAPGADVPAAASANGGGTVPINEGAAAAKTEQNRLIHVRTDVLDIQIDRQGGDIVYAALPKFTAQLDTPDVPFVLLQQDQKRVYIAQSGLIGIDSNSGRPLYRSDNSEYTLASDAETLTVTLSFETEQHIAVQKIFRFKRGDYLIGIDYHIENKSDMPWQGTMYGRLKRDDSKDPSVSSGGFGISSFLGAAINKVDAASAKNDGYHKLPFKDMADKPLKLQEQGGWLAFVQHYFLSAWIPPADQPNHFETATRDGMHLGWFTSATQTVAPNASADFNSRFYAGPKDQYRLRAISPGLDLAVDYGFLWWIAQPLFWFLTKIHALLGNWGWSIMVLTLGVKIVFFGLNAKAYKSMANMRRLQPKMVEIRERYADDKQKQSMEMMNLYKQEKINPLGGCLPMLVQMPVFLALYWMLLESVELRHAPWVLWIKDLSTMDPYYVLPIIMGVTMFFQQKLNPPPPDPMQAKMMQYMPIMFTFFFLWFPAGLVLYYIVNNLLSIVQQYIITKRIVKA